MDEEFQMKILKRQYNTDFLLSLATTIIAFVGIITVTKEISFLNQFKGIIYGISLLIIGVCTFFVWFFLYHIFILRE